MIDEGIFNHWVKKTIKQLMQPYADSLNIDDLRQDAYLAAYQFLRYCQDNKSAINYGMCKNRMIQALERNDKKYKNHGITYVDNDIDIEMEDDVENKARL